MGKGGNGRGGRTAPGHCVSLCLSHDADFFLSSSFPLFLLLFFSLCALTPLRLHIHVHTTTSLHYFPLVLYAAHAPSTPPTLPFMVRFLRYAFGAFPPLAPHRPLMRYASPLHPSSSSFCSCACDGNLFKTPNTLAPGTGVCEINTHPTCGPSWAAPAPCHAQCQGHTQAECNRRVK